MVQPPKAGVFRGLSFAEYQAIPALNFSRAKALHKSGLHFASQRDFGPTEEMLLGRLVHTRVLEGDHKVPDEYLLYEKFDRRSTAAKEKWAGLVESAETRKLTLCSDQVLKDSTPIVDAITKHRLAKRLLENALTEVSLVWSDELTGVWCKARVDFWNEDLKLFGDIKTTVDASESEFSKTVMKRRYAQQAQFYLWGGQVLGMKVDKFAFIAAETDTPFAVGVFEPDQELLDWAQSENFGLLARYSACSAKGEWPGYPDVIQRLRLPKWLENRL